jgi:hypothetical protein
MPSHADEKSRRPRGFDDTGVVDFELMPFDERTSELFPTTCRSVLSGYATLSGDSTLAQPGADLASRRSRPGLRRIAVAAVVAVGAALLFTLGHLANT